MASPGKSPAKPARKLPGLPVPMIEAGAAMVAAATPATEETVMDTTTATTDAAANAKAMFADAGERAKTGMAKGQAMVADMGDFGKGNLEAMVESSKIAARGFEAMGRDVAQFMRGQFEDMQAQARTLASVTSPSEFMKLQGDFARTSFDKMVAETSRGTEAMLKLAGEVAQPISNRVALAADKMKVAA